MAPAQAALIRAVSGTATRVRDDVVAISEACMLTTVREAAGPVAGVDPLLLGAAGRVGVGRRRPIQNRTPAVAVGVLAAAAVGQAPAPQHPVHAARYQRTRSRLGRQRGPRSPASTSLASPPRRRTPPESGLPRCRVNGGRRELVDASLGPLGALHVTTRHCLTRHPAGHWR